MAGGSPQPLDYYVPSAPPARPPRPPRRKYLGATRCYAYRFLYRGGLAALFVVIAFYLGPNLYMFHKLTGLSPADFTATAQAALPTVQAIEAYRQDHGQLPADLEGLVPHYLPLVNRGPQEIENGKLWIWAHWNHSVTYEFTRGSEGWWVKGPFANGRIPMPPPPPTEAATRP